MGFKITEDELREMIKDVIKEETEYQKFSTYVKEINLENVLEMDDNTNLQGELACSGGACEIV